MSHPIFFKINAGYRSRSDIESIISQLDALINSLITEAIVSVAGGNIIEYELDTGQTKTKVKRFSTATEVQEAIEGYERLRVYYQNKLICRRTRLVPDRNFRRTRRC